MVRDLTAEGGIHVGVTVQGIGKTSVAVGKESTLDYFFDTVKY